MPAPVPDDPILPALPPGDGSALIFDWSRPRWRRTRLMVALGIAAAGHVLVFYLFKVVTPPTTRTLPPVRGSLLLTTAAPASRLLLERMEDQQPGLTTFAPLGEPDEAALHRLVKGYEPTWQRHAAALKPLPPSAEGVRLPSLIPGPPLLLPPLAAPEPFPAGPSLSASIAASTTLGSPPPLPRPLPVLAIQSGLGGRDILQPPVWPAEVTQPDWPDEGPASFLIALAADGRVTSCLPLNSPAGLDLEILRRPLLAMRFAPRQDSDDPAWGWIDIQW